jgi:hypothetical protein
MLRILEKIHVVSERGSGSEKNNSGSTFLPERMMSTHVWLAFCSAYSRLELKICFTLICSNFINTYNTRQHAPALHKEAQKPPIFYGNFSQPGEALGNKFKLFKQSRKRMKKCLFNISILHSIHLCHICYRLAWPQF